MFKDPTASQGPTPNSSSANIPNGYAKANEAVPTTQKEMKISDFEVHQKIQSLFEKDTKAIIWGQQTRAIQVKTILDNVQKNIFREC